MEAYQCGENAVQLQRSDMEDEPTQKGGNLYSCSHWLRRALPVEHVVQNPKVTLVSYLLVQLVIWAHLAQFELRSADDVVAIGSAAQKAANSILRIFGPNEDPFSLHRSTELGMWLEVIVRPRGNASLLDEAAVGEVHQLDGMLKKMNVSLLTADGRVDQVMQAESSKPRSDQFQLQDVCAKQTATLCSVDGSFILQKEFLRDVADEDLQRSASGFYSYPRRGLPSYGPYMFGNRMSLSKHGMIRDVNALRFRYNLRGSMVRQPGTLSTLRSARWEESASKLISNYRPKHIRVFHATSTQLKNAIVGQNKQGLPFLAAAIVGYFVTLAIALPRLTTSPRKYIFSVGAVLFNITTVLTSFGLLALFHYKPTAPSVLAVAAIIVIGTHQFSVLLARFDDVHRRRYLADNKLLSTTAFNTVFRQLANNTLAILVFSSVVGFTTNIRDIQSSCVVAAIGSIVIAVNCLFAYLPLCDVGYRVETLQLNKYKHPYLAHDRSGRTHGQHCRLLESCGKRILIKQDSSRAKSRKQQRWESSRKERFVKISMYTGVFTLTVLIGLLLASLMCARNKLKRCADEGTNHSVKCGLVHATMFRQSDLLLPSLRTRRSLKSQEEPRQNKSLALSTALYTFLKTAEADFTAGAPIQLVYESANSTSDVCATLNASRALVSKCKLMPETDRNFEIAWYKVFRGPSRGQDLSASLFAKDLVLKANAVDKNDSANSLALPCSFVNDYRVYCSFKSMKMNMAAIGTMRALAEMAQNATLTLQRSGRFTTFSLLFLVLELVEGTYKSLMIGAAVYLAVALIPCLFHEMFFAALGKLKRKARHGGPMPLNGKQQGLQSDVKRLWNVAIYILETVDIFLLSYVYICLADIPVDFVNAGLVLIGFLLMPLCLVGNLLTEVVEDNRPVMNAVENEESSAPEEEMTPVRARHHSFKHQCSGDSSLVKDSVDSRASIFIPHKNDVVSPLIVSTAPLVWFAFMLPFTDSPLLRTLEHVCLCTCIRGIFAGNFVYISLKGFFSRK